MHSWLRHEQPTAETLLGFQDEGQAGMSSWLETWGTRGQLKLGTAGKPLAQQHQCSGCVSELLSTLIPSTAEAAPICRDQALP